jgi:hypothetical protein
MVIRAGVCRITVKNRSNSQENVTRLREKIAEVERRG